ncbi:MAG: hypothetical protein E6J76_16505 [Deltaproteobacteria bacterium]|nr:MAG: hypothetical protein E6J76_16505 [Deltaproteobacteria bacterium]
MSDFSDCFLLIFGQLAVGGLIGLAVPPFTMLERGFYKSTATVFVGCAVLFVAGKTTLVLRAGEANAARLGEIGVWAIFTVAAAVYLTSLWGDARRQRARAYTIALGLGLVALGVSASLRRLGPVLSPATLLYPLAFLTSALVLGAVATGLSLGHWYLIDLGLSIEPLRRLFRYFVIVLLVHLAVLAMTLVTMALGSGPGPAAVATLWREHALLLALRIVLGPLTALGLGYLIHRTLEIPQTMAATGLFYIAILAVMVGELLGRLLLFRTALPL